MPPWTVAATLIKMPQFQAISAPGSPPISIGSTLSGFAGHVLPWNLKLSETTLATYAERVSFVGAPNAHEAGDAGPTKLSTTGSP